MTICQLSLQDETHRIARERSPVLRVDRTIEFLSFLKCFQGFINCLIPGQEYQSADPLNVGLVDDTSLDVLGPPIQQVQGILIVFMEIQNH